MDLTVSKQNTPPNKQTKPKINKEKNHQMLLNLVGGKEVR